MAHPAGPLTPVPTVPHRLDPASVVRDYLDHLAVERGVATGR